MHRADPTQIFLIGVWGSPVPAKLATAEQARDISTRIKVGRFSRLVFGSKGYYMVIATPVDTAEEEINEIVHDDSIPDPDGIFSTRSKTDILSTYAALTRIAPVLRGRTYYMFKFYTNTRDDPDYCPIIGTSPVIVILHRYELLGNPITILVGPAGGHFTKQTRSIIDIATNGDYRAVLTMVYTWRVQQNAQYPIYRTKLLAQIDVNNIHKYNASQLSLRTTRKQKQFAEDNVSRFMAEQQHGDVIITCEERANPDGEWNYVSEFYGPHLALLEGILQPYQIALYSSGGPADDVTYDDGGDGDE